MFEIKPSMRQIQAGREQIVSLSSSINHPHVAVPGKTTQKAEAFLVELREAGDLSVVLISLWLDLERGQVVYGADPVPSDEIEEVRSEAISFCESMGFIMEEIPFRGLDPMSQDELLARLPPFSSERARLAASLVGVDPNPSPTGPHAIPPRGLGGMQERAPAQEPMAQDDLRRLGRFLATF